MGTGSAESGLCGARSGLRESVGPLALLPRAARTLLMLEFVSLSLDTRIHGDENVDILLVPRLLVNTSSGKSPGKGRQEPPPPPRAVFNVRHTPGGCRLTGMNSAVLWPEPSLFTSCKILPTPALPVYYTMFLKAREQ